MTDHLIQRTAPDGETAINRFANEAQALKSFAFLSGQRAEGGTVILIARGEGSYSVMDRVGDAPVDESKVWATPDKRDIVARNFYMTKPANEHITWEEAKKHAIDYPTQINARLVKEAFEKADETIKASL